MSRLPAFPELREVNRDRIAFDHRAADRGEIQCQFIFSRNPMSVHLFGQE